MATTTPQRLRGKVAIVTAATLGIGYAVAERLAQEGAAVVISSRKKDNVDRAMGELRSKGLEVYGMPCHVGKAEDRKKLVQETVRRYGGVDILVSNAGTNPTMEPLLNTSEEVYDKVFDVNVKAGLYLVQEVAPYMEKRGGGAIVMVTSQAAYGSEALPVYGASKTAMLGVMVNLTPELARMNIRVNCLAPGLIKTKFSEALWSNEAVLDRLKANVPLGRMGTVEEMAAITAFLVSEDSSYITGETIVANGGRFSRL